METKICKKCEEEKELEDFPLHKNKRIGICNICYKLYKKKYYDDNKDKFKEYNKQYKENADVSVINGYAKKYRDNNKDKISQKRDTEEHKEYQRLFFKNNPDKVKKYRDKYKKSENCKKHRKNWYEKMKSDGKYYIYIWRHLLRETMKRMNKKKSEKTIELLGYSAEQLKNHLENLFTSGMTWENYGEWHIDHIKPLISFSDATEPSIVNSFDNIRPMWSTTREIDGVVYEGNLNKSIKDKKQKIKQ